MIDKTGRVELKQGTRTRWVKPEDVSEFVARGWSAEDAPVQAVLKPRKKDTAVEETVVEQPTISEE